MKKVLLLPDIKGWAYDIIAQNIAPHFKKYKPTIKYVQDVLSKKEYIDYNEYDVIYAFFWFDMHQMEAKYYKNFSYNKTVVGVHGINSWEKRNISIPQVNKILSKYRAIGCISRELCNILKNNNNIIYTPSGFDPIYFKPEIIPALNDNKLKIIWVGDPSTKHHGNIKGFNIIESLLNKRNDLELILATKDNKISYNLMPSIYNKGHVYVCMSKSEGSPLPLIESMACGRPVISTSVGVAPEVIKNGINGYIINRTEQDLSIAIDNIKKQNLNKMGQEAYRAVSNRTWRDSAAHYERLFDRV